MILASVPRRRNRSQRHLEVYDEATFAAIVAQRNYRIRTARLVVAATYIQGVILEPSQEKAPRLRKKIKSRAWPNRPMLGWELP